MKTKVSKKNKAKKIFSRKYAKEIKSGAFDIGRSVSSVLQSIYKKLK